MYCEYSLESPRQDDSNEWNTHNICFMEKYGKLSLNDYEIPTSSVSLGHDSTCFVVDFFSLCSLLSLLLFSLSACHVSEAHKTHTVYHSNPKYSDRQVGLHLGLHLSDTLLHGQTILLKYKD